MNQLHVMVTYSQVHLVVVEMEIVLVQINVNAQQDTLVSFVRPKYKLFFDKTKKNWIKNQFSSRFIFTNDYLLMIGHFQPIKSIRENKKKQKVNMVLENLVGVPKVAPAGKTQHWKSNLIYNSWCYLCYYQYNLCSRSWYYYCWNL